MFLDGNGESFVFKADDDNITFFKWTGLNDFCMWSTEEKIAMGGGGDGFAFVIDTNFIAGETSKSATFGNPPLVNSSIAGELDIHLGNVNIDDGKIRRISLNSANSSKAGCASTSFTISNIECWGFQSSF